MMPYRVNNHSGEQIAQIRVQADALAEDGFGRNHRFHIEQGGRALWQAWFDHQPVFINHNDTDYPATISAFPNNARSDFGYILIKTR